MKKIYKGFEIEVSRERVLGGWSELCVAVFRVSDLREMTSFHEDSEEKVRNMVKYMQERIDNWIKNGKGDEENF